MWHMDFDCPKSCSCTYLQLHLHGTLGATLACGLPEVFALACSLPELLYFSVQSTWTFTLQQAV
jgi:hypothetical protein